MSILNFWVYFKGSVSAPLLSRHTIKAKLFSTLFSSLGQNLPGINSRSFQTVFVIMLGSPVDRPAQCPSLCLCHCGLLLSPDPNKQHNWHVQSVLGVWRHSLLSEYQSLQTPGPRDINVVFHWESNLASSALSRAIFPLSLPDCSYW